MINPKWYKTNLTAFSLFNIPEKSGIYIFLHEHKVFDLVLQRDVLYVGQTNDLKRRIKEHIAQERNSELMKYNLSSICCYYTKVNNEDLDFIEGSIYRICQPPANFICPPNSSQHWNPEDFSSSDLH